MNEGLPNRKLELIRRNKQSVFLKTIESSMSSSLVSEIRFLSLEESLKLELSARRATPIGNEVYYPNQNSMIRAVSVWIKKQNQDLVFFSSSGAFVLDSRHVPTNDDFLIIFADGSGIARLDCNGGVKYGDCEGLYVQIWPETTCNL